MRYLIYNTYTRKYIDIEIIEFFQEFFLREFLKFSNGRIMKYKNLIKQKNKIYNKILSILEVSILSQMYI